MIPKRSRGALRDTALGALSGLAAEAGIGKTAYGPLTLSMSRSTWYRSIGRADLGLRDLFQKPSQAQPHLGKTFRAYTTMGRVKVLRDGRYLAETGEIIDPRLPRARVETNFSPRWSRTTRLVASAGAAFGLNASIQGVGDYYFEPHLTLGQRLGRAAVGGSGGVVSWILGGIATEYIAGTSAGSWAGLVGIVVSGVVSFAWIKVVQPVVFELFGLDSQKLVPLPK